MGLALRSLGLTGDFVAVSYRSHREITPHFLFESSVIHLYEALEQRGVKYAIRRLSQLRLAYKEFLARPNFSRAKDLKLSTTSARTRLLTAIPISDIGILSTMSQAITEATLCSTADAGKMAIPMCASTSEISVEISAAFWETLGTILASRSIPKIRSWNPGA